MISEVVVMKKTISTIRKLKKFIHPQNFRHISYIYLLVSSFSLLSLYALRKRCHHVPQRIKLNKVTIKVTTKPTLETNSIPIGAINQIGRTQRWNRTKCGHQKQVFLLIIIKRIQYLMIQTIQFVLQGFLRMQISYKINSE